MSTINVNNLSGKGGATPNLPDGAVISGVATVTNLKPTNVNVSGAVTATTFDGSLKSTGTPTLGLGVTINSSGVNVSGVLTATSFVGSGSGLTGVGETIAPWNYNPDINDTNVTPQTGIGITFNKKLYAGSGTATLKVVNAGAAGTTIQSWGISSATIGVTELTFGSLVSDLLINQTYQVDIPSGFVVDSNETSYAGTAYTFTVQPASRNLFAWGRNNSGDLGLSNQTQYSSPKQVTGGTWAKFYGGSTHDMDGGKFKHHVKGLDGTGELFGWGMNQSGQLGDGTATYRSSPIQIPGTTWTNKINGDYGQALAIKSDGTLWAIGYNYYGSLGLNTSGGPSSISSPTQVGSGTDWATVVSHKAAAATKTDGTLWMWGYGDNGQLGQNAVVTVSSPVQIPGTSWRNCVTTSDSKHTIATRTDGTLWSWGLNNYGQLGLNQSGNADYSSPVQIPGTNWSEAIAVTFYSSVASKTDGTLWTWGLNNNGVLGLNGATHRSSPTQIPGTSWSTEWSQIASAYRSFSITRTNGTLWAWGYNNAGQLGQENTTQYSSPVQVGSDTDWESVSSNTYSYYGTKLDTTP